MRWLLALSALSGFLAVALGAFGAHGLKGRVSALPDGARRLEWWQTAANYQLSHALAMGLAALLAERMPAGALSLAGAAFFIGTLLFSGSLYVMGLTGVRALGAVTPLGGLGFLVGWVCLLWATLQH
jgi:uncharacterized membrane protein YgdD (TMEM256/DUF423 family)